MKTRTMSVAGSFYPAKAAEVTSMIERFNAIVQEHPEAEKELEALRGRAVIVPHAGWVYSGFTANIAYRVLSRGAPTSVVVIGPSHRVPFEGISVCDAEAYLTPLGELRIDTRLVAELKKRFSLPSFPEAHHEHSTEVQMPFLKYYLPDVSIVELVYGYADPSDLGVLIDYLLEREGCAVVISTDLSHYYPLDQAQRLDAICLEAIRLSEGSMLHRGCEACGAIGVEAMLDVARKRALEAVVLDYRTSADASGDRTRVVGYASALFRGGLAP